MIKVAPDLREWALKGRIVEPRIGIKKASTFTGFCAAHDRGMFRVIDNPNVVWDREAAFLLSYRTLCRERFAKRCAAEFLAEASMFDRGMGPDQQLDVQQSLSISQANARAANESGERLKDRYDQIMTANTLDAFEHVTLQFEGVPHLAVSGGFEPDLALGGQCLQDLYDFSTDPELITLNLLPTKHGTILSLGWLHDPRGICRKYANELLHDQRLGAFVFAGLANIENAFARPTMWKELAPNEVDLARHLIRCIEKPSRKRFQNEWDWLVRRFPSRGVQT